MTPDRDDSFMNALNEVFGNALGGSQVSYRYFRLKAHAAGNMREEWYAYGTKRSKGPAGSGAAGWWSWVWVWSAPKGPTKRQVGTITRATRCATRRRATNVAYRRLLARQDKEPQDYPITRRHPFLPLQVAPQAPLACPGCGRGVGVSWTRADQRWLCDECRAAGLAALGPISADTAQRHDGSQTPKEEDGA